MTDLYADADAGLDGHTTGDQACECGVDHNSGLGERFYQLAITFGPEFPIVRQAVEDVLTTRGVDLSVLDDLTNSEWTSLFADLSVPNNMPHVDWIDDADAGTDALAASKWLANEIVEALKPVFTLLQTLHDIKIRLAETHAEIVVRGLEGAIEAVNRLIAMQTNPAFPEANYVLPPEQVTADCPAISDIGASFLGDVGGGKFADWVHNATDERAWVTVEFDQALRDAIVKAQANEDSLTAEEFAEAVTATLRKIREQYGERFAATVSDHDTGYQAKVDDGHSTGQVVSAPEAPDPSVIDE